MRMRTRMGRGAQESSNWSAKAPVTHGRGLAVGRTPPPTRPKTAAPQAFLPSQDSAPHRLVPVFPPRRTVVDEIGEALGEDFSTVRFETRSREAVTLGAPAFARREQVCFAPGQYRPDTSMGLRLIAHELAHVVQQRRSPVPATGTIGGLEVNEDPRLELEADQLGSRAAVRASGAPGPLPPPITPHGMAASSPAQMGKDNPAVREANRQKIKKQAERRRELEKQRKKDELRRLTNKSTDELRHQWSGIRLRTNRTFGKIQEIDLISQSHPRLQGADQDIAQRLRQLDRQVKILTDNFDLPGARRNDQAVADDKQVLAEIILEGRELETRLGVIGSDAEARLGPREDFAGDLNAQLYHTGAPNDPIPIVWYKDPATDYEDIVIPPANVGGVTAGTYSYPNGPTTAQGFPVNMTVAPANRPVLNNLAAFTLQKQPIGSRPDKTPNQVALNAALKNGGYDLRLQNPRMDGDHVRDLGFGGADAVNNYWPLDEDINRRAFHGYNSSYLVNFINHNKDTTQVNANGNPNGRPTTQPIGGMAGRHFVIKDFMDNNDGNIPDESETETAGTA